MLQIVTKKYFRPGARLHSTVHRQVLHTNRSFLTAEPIELPVGRLLPSTGVEPVSTVTLEITEHLEADDGSGAGATLVATGGLDLVDDLADVLSFASNSTFSRDGDLVRQLVPGSIDGPPRGTAASLFRDTFDPTRVLLEPELEQVRAFIWALLELRRKQYEAAMRAIRRVVRAGRRAVEDPTLAYVDLVAAIESLSELGPEAPAVPWDALDARKRAPVDKALQGADEAVAERVRAAVLEAERAGARRRFVALVVDSVTPAFFREEATGALRPIRGADFERAVKRAYDVRSSSVHTLEDLPREAWVLGDRADTVSPPGMGVMLSLEGLARLARHVVRRYVERAPVGVDESFQWRSSLPGVIRMQVAPQHWVFNAEGLDVRSAPRYLAGFAEVLVEVLAGRSEAMVDMRAVLEQIERQVGGLQDGTAKASMVALYALWHRTLGPEHARPNAQALLERHAALLERPCLPAFVTGLLSDRLPPWSGDEWLALAGERRAERSRRDALELPARLDAALQALAAAKLLDEGRTAQAVALAAEAVEELPGDPVLMAWEASVLAGEVRPLALRALVLRVEEQAGARENEAAGAAPEGPPCDHADSAEAQDRH